MWLLRSLGPQGPPRRPPQTCRGGTHHFSATLSTCPHCPVHFLTSASPRPPTLGQSIPCPGPEPVVSQGSPHPFRGDWALETKVCSRVCSQLLGRLCSRGPLRAQGWHPEFTWIAPSHPSASSSPSLIPHLYLVDSYETGNILQKMAMPRGLAEHPLLHSENPRS